MIKHLHLKFLLLLCALMAGSGSVWATENDTHDFEQNFSQLLNNNASISSINIVKQSYPVKKVIVSYRYNKTLPNAVTVEVTVAGTSWGTKYTEGTGSNYSTLEFTGAAATGAIVISFTNNTGNGTGHGTFYVDNVQLVEGASAAPSYTITAQSNNNSYGTVSLSGSVITAAPAEGYTYAAPAYTVTTGTATVVQNGNEFTVTPSSDCTVRINFEAIPSYTITTTVNNSDYGTVSDGGSILDGTTTTVTATPNTNYRVVAGDGGYTVTNGSATVTNNGDNTFTVSPSSDCTVQINFEEIPTHTLSSAVTPTNSGSVTLGASSVREGSTTTATASAEDGYIFKYWSIDGEGSSIPNTTDNPVTVTMGTADATITANFAAVYPVTWIVNGVTVKTKDFEEGTNLSDEFPAVPNLGSKVFRGWVTTSTVANDFDEAGFVNTSSATAPANALIYYAVFATATGTPVAFSGYEKVTTEQDDWSGTYLLGATYNGGSTESLKGTWIYSAPASSGNYGDRVAIGELTTEQSDYEIVIAKSTNGYTIYHPNSKKYFAYDASDNKLNFADAVSSKKQEWTITDVAVIKNANTTGRILKYNGSSPRFACYTSGQTATDLYRRIESGGVAYSDYCTTITNMPVTITTAEYATYCGDLALDFSTTGIKAYTATDGETKVTLNEITSGQVPANTPVVLYKVGADGTAINVPVIAEAEAITGTNDLRVSTGTDVDYMYVLANGSDGVGFYPWAKDEEDLAAGKVYLQAKASYGARQFLGFSEATGIANVNNGNNGNFCSENTFDLQGRRVAQPQKGLYIVNGKKVIIK